MISRFSYPTQVVFGVGAIAELPALVEEMGTTALVVTDPGLVGLPPFEALTGVLDQAQIPFAVYSGINPNPLSTDIDAGVEAYREVGADFIIAIGGGSALDGAKAIQLMTTHDGTIIDYDDAAGGSELITPNLPSMVTIPTTAGTGSEVGRSTVITDVESHTKKVIFSPFLMPDVAIIDPELMRGLPPHLTAATGMDALAHNVEAYLSKGYHPMADALALGGIKLIAKSLQRAVDHGDDLEARADMAMAAMIGATAFQKGLGVCHSLAHPLSTLAGMHHGLANGILLAEVMRFNADVVPERVAEIGACFGVEGAEAACEAVHKLALAVGMPATLPDAGVDAGLLDALADQAIKDGCHQCNPRDCTRDDMVDLYRKFF